MQKLTTLWHANHRIAFAVLACLVGGCGGGGADVAATPNEPIPTATPGSWTVNLRWDASTDTGVYGYRVYHGLSANASSEQSEIVVTTSFDLDVTTSGRHYFSVAALDAYNRESPRSQILALTID